MRTVAANYFGGAPVAVISCDAGSRRCTNEVLARGDDIAEALEAVDEIAREQGWRFHDSGHECPECMAASRG